MIEPVTKFFGMGWRTFMAFLSSAFAKEAVLVSTHDPELLALCCDEVLHIESGRVVVSD